MLWCSESQRNSSHYKNLKIYFTWVDDFDSNVFFSLVFFCLLPCCCNHAVPCIHPQYHLLSLVPTHIVVAPKVKPSQHSHLTLGATSDHHCIDRGGSRLGTGWGVGGGDRVRRCRTTPVSLSQRKSAAGLEPVGFIHNHLGINLPRASEQPAHRPWTHFSSFHTF